MEQLLGDTSYQHSSYEKTSTHSNSRSLEKVTPSVQLDQVW
jgi:hypothetical protein